MQPRLHLAHLDDDEIKRERKRQQDDDVRCVRDEPEKEHGGIVSEWGGERKRPPKGEQSPS